MQTKTKTTGSCSRSELRAMCLFLIVLTTVLPGDVTRYAGDQQNNSYGCRHGPDAKTSTKKRRCVTSPDCLLILIEA